MIPSFEEVKKILKTLPGLGYRSAEKVALSLLVEEPQTLHLLLDALSIAAEKLSTCPLCGNIAENNVCFICSNQTRDRSNICIVESVSDLFAIERSGTFNGQYHVLNGKLSPIRGITPSKLNFEPLKKRILSDEVKELIFALSNDVEGEVTCHYIRENIINTQTIKSSRIAFGLPSGGEVIFADSQTLKSAFEGRRQL